MNVLTVADIAIKTMTSREIAELTGKEHKHVLADVRKMLDDLGKAAADFSATAQIPGPNGSTRTVEVFHLPKRETLILVSGYSVAMRARIIDRWQELEAAAAPNRDAMEALNDPSFLRQTLLTYSQKLIEANTQVAELTPKAAALDRIATRSEGAMNMTNAAKTLQVPPQQFIRWLAANDWIYRRAGGSEWIAYQDRLKSGVLEHKTATVECTDGSERVCTQVLVTAKGLATLSKRFSGPSNDPQAFLKA